MSAAIALERYGVEHVVLERAAFAGGLATTRVEGGWRFDNTGHLLHLRDDIWRSRVLSWLDEEPLLIDRRSVVFTHGCYTDYPFQANTQGLPAQVAYECLVGFIRARLNPSPEPARNFEDFCRRHFGEGISEYFMLPYNERLWGVPAREITTAWCDRFVPVPELEDVVAGAVGLKRKPLGYNAQFYYPRRGIGELTQSLARRVTRLLLNQNIRAVDLAHHRVELDDKTITFDVLINTAPLPSVLDQTPDLAGTVAEARQRLRCSHLWYLDVGLRRKPGIDAHWIYVPEAKYPFYRVGSYSHFSSALVPPGQGSLYVELASRDEPELAVVLPKVAAGLRELGIIEHPDEIEFARPRKIDFAYVIYDQHHAGSLATIIPYLEKFSVITAGRYGGWNYSAMEDALRFGEAAAGRALEFLT